VRITTVTDFNEGVVSGADQEGNPRDATTFLEASPTRRRPLARS
jgi:hypothetical protein